MKKLSVVMCSWRSPKLLSPCIRSLKRSFTTEAEIIVVLNEADRTSVELLMDEDIQFIKLNKNYGTLAVDFASHLLQSEYIVSCNDDMLFHPGWDQDLIQILEENYPASASCHLVEPFPTGNPVVVVDPLLGPLESTPFDQLYHLFIQNHNEGKYRIRPRISHTHPILVKAQDYFQIGGYSELFDMNWYPGYSLDNYFCWRLWKLLGPKYRPITSGESCVYHGVSMTMKKLSPQDQTRNNADYFQHKTGMTIEEFKREIRYEELIF